MNKFIRIKNWPTWKIKEVLAENYTRGCMGTDYEEIRGELQQELWSRQSKQAEVEAERVEKEMEEQEEGGWKKRWGIPSQKIREDENPLD